MTTYAMNVSLRYISVCLSLFTLYISHVVTSRSISQLARFALHISLFHISLFWFRERVVPCMAGALALAMATVVVGRRRRRRREEETGGEGVATSRSTLTYHKPSLLPASEERCGRVCKGSDHRFNAHLTTTAPDAGRVPRSILIEGVSCGERLLPTSHTGPVRPRAAGIGRKAHWVSDRLHLASCTWEGLWVGFMRHVKYHGRETPQCVPG